jgi:FecR-like protein
LQGHPTLKRVTVAVSLFLLAAVGAQAQSESVRARVRSVTGIARIQVSPQSAAAALKRNATIEPYNIIETGQNSRVVIDLTDGGQITVLPNSRVVLKNFIVPHTARELIEIIIGRVIVKIRHVGGKPNPYRLNSPTASIAVRGTEFIVDVLSGGETLVAVREGLVEVWSHDNPDNKRLVTPGSRVIVRPGGGISSAFPGPGSELNGRARFNGDLGDDYQRSVDSVTQNSDEIAPVFFSAFPDQHMDSLENPAYAAEFKNAEGRLLLLPSASDPDRLDLLNSQENYSISPQLTFFSPIPGSRFTVGGGVSGLGVRSQTRANSPFTDDRYHNHQDLRLNAYNVSFIAAYSIGDQGKTSVGIGVDALSGYGKFGSDFAFTQDGISNRSLDKLRALFARTRLTFGVTRRFSDTSKLGLYYRHGINSSDQENKYLQEYMDESRRKTSHSTLDSTRISNVSSEIGARFRASLTRRLFYGVEGSFLYERINSRRETLSRSTAYNRYHYLARRARLGAGLGFVLTPKILLDFDVAGGIFNNDRPPQEPINPGGSFLISSLTPGSLRSVRGTSVSAHASVQTNLWRGLFLSVSSMMTVRRDVIAYSYLGGTYTFNGVKYSYEGGTATYKDYHDAKLSNAGIGWKFKPNLIGEYLYSVDHRYRVPNHSLRLRYTFNLGITGEK